MNILKMLYEYSTNKKKEKEKEKNKKRKKQEKKKTVARFIHKIRQNTFDPLKQPLIYFFVFLSFNSLLIFDIFLYQLFHLYSAFFPNLDHLP